MNPNKTGMNELYLATYVPDYHPNLTYEMGVLLEQCW